MREGYGNNANIPRFINLCYSHKGVPGFVVDDLVLLNPGYEVRLFDDAECRAFLGDRFGGRHADCFDYIQNGPIKADFWRACLIYSEGGVYFDVDVEHEMGVDEYLETGSTFMTSTSSDPGRVNPIVLMSARGNPALGACVDRYMEMFEARAHYEYWAWSICPMLYRALEAVVGRPFGNDQQGVLEVGAERYQFANEEGRDFTRYRGSRIFKNRRNSYRRSGGVHDRAFVAGAESPAFEDERLRIEVADHPHRDEFEVGVSGGVVAVRRTDQDTGWGQNLMLKVRYKSSGRESRVSVGPSSESVKRVALPVWSRANPGGASPKMLMILAGEAFRGPATGTRQRDSEGSLEPQRRASLSHVSFLDHLKSARGLGCDVVISSYRTKHEEELLGWYGGRLVASSFKGDLVGLEQLVRDAIAEVDLSPYECLFVSRLDIEYKDYLKEVFDPGWQRVTFPSVCWAHQGYFNASPAWVPRVSDTMEFVPKRFFRRVQSGFLLSHTAWQGYLNGGMSNDDLGFMLDTFHDSDSAKDYNPIYRMASRRDSDKWYSPNLRVAPDRSPVRCFGYIGFPDWRQPVTEPYEDDDFLISYKYDCHLRGERFSISMDGKYVVVRRADSDGGWGTTVVLMVRDKGTGEERELFVGKSESNESRVRVDRKPGTWEDDEFEVHVKPHEFPDVFHLSHEGGGRFEVTRVDVVGGWGQPLSLVARHKATGRVRPVFVGPSESNKKSVEVDLSPPRKNQRPRVALCVRGAVSRVDGPSMTRGSIYKANGGYVNYRAVARSVEEHILKPNSHMDIDVFVHSWNRDLAADLEGLYRPAASIFEDNEMYADEIQARCRDPRDFSGVSHALSCKRVIQIAEQHERDGGAPYDLVVLYRPDVLLWKDMPLDLYDASRGVFVNAHPGGNGDFHFVMSPVDASLFKGLYDSPLQGNPQAMHHWIRRFVEDYMKRPVIMDDIVPGRDQEVIRPHKMRASPVNVYKVGLDRLSRYGLTKEDM